tara:strand:+ start:1598 stop:1816 length:219 start_codon:yes stop_codon:yes gene_type:complete
MKPDLLFEPVYPLYVKPKPIVNKIHDSKYRTNFLLLNIPTRYFIANIIENLTVIHIYHNGCMFIYIKNIKIF